MKTRFAIALLFLLFVVNCAPRMSTIQPLTPYERPAYTITSPLGEGWHHQETDYIGKHVLAFFLTPISRTHTRYATIEEIPSDAKFESPEQFLTVLKKMYGMGTDPRRFTKIEEEIKLDQKFGDYTVIVYSKMEDHGAAVASDSPFLIMKTYRYSFLHPYVKNLMVDITYSERGRATELDADFNEKATSFVDGFRLKGQ